MNAIDLSHCFLKKPVTSLETLVLTCALAEAERVGARPLLRGLSPEDLDALCARNLPGYRPLGDSTGNLAIDEFEELYALLLDHADPLDDTAIWLAAAMASAAQRPNHLWQDLGLPSRQELSDILEMRFPRLAALNRENMKWKKFFYRQLCERAGVPICKSPHCVDCVDKLLCFGAEI